MALLPNCPPKAAELLYNANPNRSPASWGLRYAASLPNVLTVLSGMSSMEQMIDNIQTFTDFKPLRSKDYDLLENVATEIKTAGAIGCTGCDYCKGCPVGINISRIFAMYNHYRNTKVDDVFVLAYRTIEEKAQAHNCGECGQCVEQCPQGLDIPRYLKEIVDLIPTLKPF